MIISIFGSLFLVFGILILILPLVLIELSRPRDWLTGGLLLFLGLFFLVENDFWLGSLNLLVISIAILLGRLILEIYQNRWFQLSIEEKRRIGSFERWFESLNQLAQLFIYLGNGFLNFFKGFKKQSKKSLKEKKWVHPELKKEIKKEAIDSINPATDSTDQIASDKSSNEESSEKEETS
mgnify:CR=1 FL=1|tara:strand:- start:1727 stop:2266 length:540 start_codon:yes stop_codon:yes gene_type:complete